VDSLRTVHSPRKQPAPTGSRRSCDPAQGRGRHRGLESPSPRVPRVATMEVLLLLLDEIDDLFRMVWQRASMLIG